MVERNYTDEEIKRFVENEDELREYLQSEMLKLLVQHEGMSMSQQPWDASQGANPDTCLHFISQNLAGLGVCVSCSSTLSEEYLEEFVWDFDRTYNYWMRRSIRESQAARLVERHPLLGVRDSRKFKIFREEYPAIIRFDGKLFAEDYDKHYEYTFVEISPERAEEWLRAQPEPDADDRIGMGIDAMREWSGPPRVWEHFCSYSKCVESMPRVKTRCVACGMELPAELLDRGVERPQARADSDD